MTPEQFLESFGAVSGYPDGIKKLRQLVLSLAIQGKLTTSRPSDGTVDEMLATLASKETRLAETSGKRRKKRRTSKGDSLVPAPPFTAPRGWQWLPLGSVSICRDGERIPVSRAERQNREGDYDYYGASGVIDTIDDFLFCEPLLLVGEDGANLVMRSKPIAFIARGKYWVNNHAHVLDGACEDALRYLEIYINGIDLKPFVTGTAQPKMNQAKMNSIPVAVPPLAEQKRIVAKVDHLMAMLDDLEQRQEKKRSAAIHVSKASLDSLVNAEDPDQLARAWERVSKNFGVVAGAGHPVQIRDTIRSLAVRGILTRRELGDESVDDLLRKTAARQSSLKARLKSAPKGDEHGNAFHIPPSWRHVSFRDMILSLNYGTSKKCSPEIGETPVLRIPNVTGGRIDLSDLKYADFSPSERAKWSLQAGDLLLVRTNGSASLVGLPALVPESAEHCLYAGYLVRVRLGQCANPSFVCIALQTVGVRRQIEGPIRTTTGVKNINSSEIAGLRFPLPPLQEQQRVVSIVSNLMGLVDQLENCSSRLQQATSKLAIAATRAS